MAYLEGGAMMGTCGNCGRRLIGDECRGTRRCVCTKPGAAEPRDPGRLFEAAVEVLKWSRLGGFDKATDGMKRIRYSV